MLGSTIHEKLERIEKTREISGRVALEVKETKSRVMY